MSLSIPIQTLAVRPYLSSLYHRLELLQFDSPTRILIADSPFFVHHNGKVASDEPANVRFVSKRKLRKRGLGSALLHELQIIAQGIEDDEYSPDDLDGFRERAEAIYDDLSGFHFKNDCQIAQLMRWDNALH